MVYDRLVSVSALYLIVSTVLVAHDVKRFRTKFFLNLTVYNKTSELVCAFDCDGVLFACRNAVVKEVAVTFTFKTEFSLIRVGEVDYSSRRTEKFGALSLLLAVDGEAYCIIVTNFFNIEFLTCSYSLLFVNYRTSLS